MFNNKPLFLLLILSSTIYSLNQLLSSSNLSIFGVQAAGLDFDLNELPPEFESQDLGFSNENEELSASDEQHESSPSQSTTPIPFSFSGYEHLSPKVNDQKSDKSSGKSSWSITGVLSKAGTAAANKLKKLPEYFDFEKFKSQFKRNYSPSESFYRKAMFLKRCLNVFKSKVAERLGKGGHVEEVNKFSDRSPNEIKRMFMSAPPIELRPAGQSETEYMKHMENSYNRRMSWDAELESQSSLSDLNSNSQSTGQSGNVLHESQAEEQIKQMLMSAVSESELDAISEELDGKQTDGFSQSSLKTIDTRELPWPGSIKKPENLNSFNNEQQYKPPSLEKGDNLDWSKHECFHTVYDQKDKCGKCYVMATTALAEFFKCSELTDTINKRKFSKEYVLDCGQKFKPSTIFGCKGGSMLDISRFISIAGIYNIKGWRQKQADEVEKIQNTVGDYIPELDRQCPLNQFELDFPEWGEIHVFFDPVKISANDWYEALQDAPLVASVQMPNGIESYKSGTHQGEGCETSENWHTMLLVGYGTDSNGTPYWRFRNSFGPDWGDAGHFNLAMSVSSKCLIGGVRYYRTSE